jgi:hypothetical protein
MPLPGCCLEHVDSGTIIHVTMCTRQRTESGKMVQLNQADQGGSMIFSVDTWLLPAIAASSSSYLVCLVWERFKNKTAPSGALAALLAGLSFIMGGISAYYRNRIFATSLESNVIIMFAVGASTTFLWLVLRRYFPGFNNRGKV